MMKNIYKIDFTSYDEFNGQNLNCWLSSQAESIWMKGDMTKPSRAQTFSSVQTLTGTFHHQRHDGGPQT